MTDKELATAVAEAVMQRMDAKARPIKECKFIFEGFEERQREHTETLKQTTTAQTNLLRMIEKVKSDYEHTRENVENNEAKIEHLSYQHHTLKDSMTDKLSRFKTNIATIAAPVALLTSLVVIIIALLLKS